LTVRGSTPDPPSQKLKALSERHRPKNSGQKTATAFRKKNFLWGTPVQLKQNGRAAKTVRGAKPHGPSLNRGEVDAEGDQKKTRYEFHPKGEPAPATYAKFTVRGGKVWTSDLGFPTGKKMEPARRNMLKRLPSPLTKGQPSSGIRRGGGGKDRPPQSTKEDGPLGGPSGPQQNPTQTKKSNKRKKKKKKKKTQNPKQSHTQEKINKKPPWTPR